MRAQPAYSGSCERRKTPRARHARRPHDLSAGCGFRSASFWGSGRAQLPLAQLLAVSTSTWERIERNPDGAGALSQDQLTRLSAIIGIYTALHLLFADQMADRWIKLAKRGPLFSHRTPVIAMIEGGLPHILDTRRRVDAMTGGLWRVIDQFPITRTVMERAVRPVSTARLRSSVLAGLAPDAELDMLSEREGATS